jgi:hypothetical protein
MGPDRTSEEVMTSDTRKVGANGTIDSAGYVLKGRKETRLARTPRAAIGLPNPCSRCAHCEHSIETS